ncbi:PhzF family phenazine biosynthesis protein [Cupriavidus agavae]|uniref:PhzF family phenazine biosynthesis protein n=1 Tax=Cupriavidus agavae TaxID=1001822 RepID=A0A4Q7S6W8_9BURK|nr:PhzF family phenazine biosynthesis isomerase [Cupriavidus agavae]RZT42131.1 PhzF family phenazine biosynthesis protein [Cupriavidus agavae]
MSEVTLIRVFVRDGQGGNPVPLVADARGMSAPEMQAVAAAHGHESAFVLPSEIDCDWRLRFFVPQHEMEMCGHATVGTLWALRQWGRWTTATARIETLSGVVLAYWDDAGQCVWISQPAVHAEALDAEAAGRVAAQLGLPAGPHAAINAATSRVKTLVALPSVAALDSLQPDFSTMEPLCASIGSTGLYPYAFGTPRADGRPVVHARQFPKSSGYPEDAATGIAAAALWGYLQQAGELPLRDGSAPAIAVWQGDAMGSPSEILVAPRHGESGEPAGCWLSGSVAWSEA